MINISYKDRKKQIYDFYNKYKDIDLDSITDVNDKIVDVCLKKENFENPLEEFYNITSMCSYMIEHDLYDNYFFDTYEEILEEYSEGKFDDYFLNINEDKKDLKEDINRINEYLAHDNDKMSYYDNLSEIYSEKEEK